MIKKIQNISVEYDYKKVGEKTLVFLHGFGGNLHSFQDFTTTFNNFGFSTLIINLTDYGFKTLPKNFGIYDYALVVFLLIKKLRLKDCCLVGHSFGGRISIILSSMYNCEKIFKKVILVDSAGLKKRFDILTKLKIINYKINKFLVKKKIFREEKLLKFGSDDYKSINENFKPIFNNIIKENLEYLLKFIKVDTLIVYGNDDKITPPYFAKILNKKIKNSKVVFMDGGHFAYLENKQKFIKTIKNFIMNNRW